MAFGQLSRRQSRDLSTRRPPSRVSRASTWTSRVLQLPMPGRTARPVPQVYVSTHIKPEYAAPWRWGEKIGLSTNTTSGSTTNKMAAIFLSGPRGRFSPRSLEVVEGI